ncbi:hypothetical protein I302_104481 [Kwoniella bestiolae CBS 10118]|uniref:Protein CPL1-like domain-containing protein n=1 Tax=Kwoniella bestiolae CBS 10118 TaxID=1296100 RepID=A0A1B9GBC8_9TREE|nr:hypothetical protein I302_03185 [Kwoniella bestiolae CBS 10118]OCF28328.1 hypothetical protein I302_03185 [Kwoniella bestiolae CBS 10118]
MLFTKFITLSVLSLSTFVLALPTPTINDQEGLAKRWHADHQRYHPSADESARPSPSASGIVRRKIQAPIFTGPVVLGSGEDLTRCLSQQIACPISPMTSFELQSASADTPYECISPKEDLYSCGGCATLGTGQDCTAIPGVLSVSCAIGQCNVHSCKAGFTLSSDGVCLPSIVDYTPRP